MLRELIGILDTIDSAEPGLDVPLGYRQFTEPVKWFLEVEPGGNGRVVEGSGNPPRPNLKRTSAIVPLLLVDYAPYVLGTLNGKSSPRVLRCFESFWDLMEEAHKATKNSDLAIILQVRRHWPPAGIEKVEAGDTVGVKVVGKPIPLLDPKIQEFWLAHTNRETLSSDVGQCSICGNEGPLLRLLPFGVKGFAQDVQITSFNLDAFQSYGKEQGLNAPTCFDCGSKAARALSFLLRENSPNKALLRRGEGLGQLTAVFWCGTRQAEAAVVGEFDVLEALRAPIFGGSGSGGALSQDLGKVRLLLGIPWKPKETALRVRPDAFHMLVLSNNRSRLVVRDWLYGTLEETKSHLRRFLDSAQMVGPRGEPSYAVSISSLLNVLDSGNPNLARALLECAYSGALLPETVGTLAVAKLRRGRLWKEPREAWRTHALLSLVRIQRASRGRSGLGMVPSAELDARRSDSPYLCGRLLAILERAQGIASSWSIGATVVGRTFGAAASSPKITFPPLLKIAVKAHLSDPRNVSARAAMDEVMAALDASGGFPTTLTLAQQADFALGFYHQRAAFRAQVALMENRMEETKEAS